MCLGESMCERVAVSVVRSVFIWVLGIGQRITPSSHWSAEAFLRMLSVEAMCTTEDLLLIKPRLHDIGV